MFGLYKTRGRSLDIKIPTKMCQLISVLFICLIGLGFFELSSAQLTPNYTTGSMIPPSYSFNILDNKLERHELRERALGELIKRSLQTLQRGQQNLERLYGSQSHFDERMIQIEYQLKTQEERFISRAEKFFTEQNKINQELLEKIMKLSLNVEKLLYNSNDMMKPSKLSFSSNPYTPQMLTSSASRLLKYPEYENNMHEKFDEMATYFQQLCAKPRLQDGLTNTDKEFLKELANEIQNRLNNVNTNVQNIVQKSQTETTSYIIEVEKNLHSDNEKIMNRCNTQEVSLQELHNEMITSCSKVNVSLENLSSCNSISQPLSQVMDTKASTNDINDKQREQFLDFLKTHFDIIHKNITNMQLETVTNLSATMKNEISYLWRQISIANGEINDSRDLLRLMRDRNEIFVNSILQSIASMSNKVEDIKERMTDINDNQTYLMNKLPSMPQEFSDIQQAFIGWLKQLSETIKIMQKTKKVVAS